MKTIISGCCKGVDTLGEACSKRFAVTTNEAWASLNNIPIKRFPAFWNTYGKAAGFKRNTQIICGRANSRLRRQIARYCAYDAKQLGLKVFVHEDRLLISYIINAQIIFEIYKFIFIEYD